MNRLIILTKERLEKAQTPNGSYNAKQMRAIGVGWPACKGWKEMVIGQTVELNQFLRFVVASKNKQYIAEIQNALPKLNPPITGTKPNLDIPTLLSQYESQKRKHLPSRKLSKAELTQKKREKRRAERVQRIMDYGVHAAARLIIENHRPRIPRYTLAILEKVISQNEANVEYNDIYRIYELLKECGISLAYTARGDVVCRSYTKASKIWAGQLLYIIRASSTNYCKIGVSENPRTRLRELQTSSPHPLTISLVFKTEKNAMKLEKSLHRHFRKCHCHGEWFEGVENEDIQKYIGERAQIVTEY